MEQSGQKEFQSAKLRRMQDFTEARICRRKILLAYFGEVLKKNCKNCDVCKNPPKLFNGTSIAQMALSAIARVNEQEPVGVIIELLKGSSRPEIYQKGYHELKTFAVGNKFTFKEWQNFMLQLLSLGYFEVAYDDHNKLRLTPLSKEVLFKGKKVDLVDSKEMDKYYEESKSITKTRELSHSEELFQLLRELRSKIARQEGRPPYLIFSDATLKSMSARKPVSESQLLSITGVGEYKSQKYGDEFIDIIHDFVNQNKKKKGDSYVETFSLLSKGMSVAEISDERNLKETTIYSHIAHLFSVGKLKDVSRFVPFSEFKKIEEYINKNPEENKLKPVFDALDGAVEYGKIRLVMEYLKN